MLKDLRRARVACDRIPYRPELLSLEGRLPLGAALLSAVLLYPSCLGGAVYYMGDTNGTGIAVTKVNPAGAACS